jgi:hypothetical protein
MDPPGESVQPACEIGLDGLRWRGAPVTPASGSKRTHSGVGARDKRAVRNREYSREFAEKSRPCSTEPASPPKTDALSIELRVRWGRVRGVGRATALGDWGARARVRGGDGLGIPCVLGLVWYSGVTPRGAGATDSAVGRVVGPEAPEDGVSRCDP